MRLVKQSGKLGHFGPIEGH